MEVEKGFCGLPRFVEGEEEGGREWRRAKSASHASHSDDATTPPRLYCTAFNNYPITFAK